MAGNVTAGAERIGKVFRTKRYDGFKRLLGNRDVKEARVKAIGKSIDENGYVMNPIIVNEYGEIIDGQGRFEALKRRNMPIDFVVVKGAGIADCVALNLVQKNWKTEDYINSYAEQGNTSYQYLKQLHRANPDYSYDCLYAIAKLARKGKCVNRGSFTMTAEEYSRTQKRCDFIRTAMQAMGENRKFAWKDRLCLVLAFLYEQPSVDKMLFIEKCEKYNNLLKTAGDVKEVFERFEVMYNYHTRADSKISFYRLYGDFTDRAKKETA